MRALKPRSVRLSPCAPASPAPRLTPGTLRRASRVWVMPWSSISCRGTTLTLCGVSVSGWVYLLSDGMLDW